MRQIRSHCVGFSREFSSAKDGNGSLLAIGCQIRVSRDVRVACLAGAAFAVLATFLEFADQVNLVALVVHGKQREGGVTRRSSNSMPSAGENIAGNMTELRAGTHKFAHLLDTLGCF